MKNYSYCLIHLLIFLAAMSTLQAQSPFQFREAGFLEQRLNRLGEEYKATHVTKNLKEARTPANQFAIDPDADVVYTDPRRMAPLLESIDATRRTGATKVAEAKYLEIVARIRKVQGPSSSDESIVLNHIGEFYLEMRKFDQAYQTFSEALRIRRTTVEVAKNDPYDDQRAVPQRKASQLLLAGLLTRLGQMDLAKKEFLAASAKLTEAIQINNALGTIGNLNPTYFESLLLERQDKWQEAESLWRDTIARRPVDSGTPYFHAMNEFAAFWARRGDYHTAADVVRKLFPGVQGLPSLESFLQHGRASESGNHYEDESYKAMTQILAIDRWIRDGPELAAPLVKDPIDSISAFSLQRGSDADLLRLYAWYEKIIFLRMSILLDGNSTSDRVQQAYEMLARIKGRYVAMLTELSRSMDNGILNPGVSGDHVLLPQQLAEMRERYAYAFLARALNSKQTDEQQFTEIAADERTVSEGVVATCNGCFADSLNLGALTADSAFVDIVRWERLDRKNPARSLPEYGAFVARAGQPYRYIRFGPAGEIDAAVSELEREAADFFQGGADNTNAVNQTLRNLYLRILEPMKNSLEGATTVFMVPDGQLSMVPFGALIDQEGRYFLEDHTVTYLTSWRQLATSYFGFDGKTSAAVVIANPDFDLKLPDSPDAPLHDMPTFAGFKPLPGSLLEAQYVKEALHLPPDRVLTGTLAREELLRSIRGPEILHLATHSDPFLQAKLPGQSSNYDLFEFPSVLVAQDPLLHAVIALAGANRSQNGPEDGLLTGLEVASLHLSGTKLAVLSSCQSANGSLVDGQGIPGLRAAFSIAGAHALLMNLWPVNDQASALFMKFFYSHLDLGPAEAVRQTQIHFRNEPEYRNPLYWAGYTYSDNSPANRNHVAKKDSSQFTLGKALQPEGEMLIAPRCFQFSGVSNTFSGFTTNFTARMTLGGVVHQLHRSDQIAVYDIQLPGNDVAIVSDINGTQSSGGMYASKGEGTTLTMQRTKEESSLSVRITGSTSDWIKLTGPLGLFSTLDIPEVLPPLSSYSQASVLGKKVATMGFCSAEALEQYNNGIIRRVVSQPPSAGGSIGHKDESPAPASPVAPSRTKVVPPDPNQNLARRVLSYALHGDTESVIQSAAPQANRAAITAMTAFISGKIKEIGPCRMEAETIEVHKTLWASKGGQPVPAYVALGDCEKARPRLLMFIDPDGLITRTGTGGFVSTSTATQIQQKAQALAESLLRANYAPFIKSLAPALEGQSRNIPGVVNSVVQNLGGFERIVASQKFPYVDTVVVTALYQRTAVSLEISFDTSLRIANWYIQTADKPRYFWQEFLDSP